MRKNNNGGATSLGQVYFIRIKATLRSDPGTRKKVEIDVFPGSPKINGYAAVFRKRSRPLIFEDDGRGGIPQSNCV